MKPVLAVVQEGRASSARGTDRFERTRPLADRREPGPQHRLVQRGLCCARPTLIGCRGRLIQRTAVYGPVCTVVWEGWSREAPPYPDQSRRRQQAPEGLERRAIPERTRLAGQ